MNVTVRDRGWDAYKRRMRELDGRSVKVGILAGGRTDGDGTAVVDYAIFNEFGTSRIPARPFLRHTSDTQRADAQKLAGGLAVRVAEGRMGVDRALGMLGQWFGDKVAATIRGSKGWAAPNAPSTAARKGSSTPLIDQGRLLNAVRHEVE